jgi:hypothetical protein
VWYDLCFFFFGWLVGWLVGFDSKQSHGIETMTVHVPFFLPWAGAKKNEPTKNKIGKQF